MSFKTSNTELRFYYPLNEASGTPILKNYASLTAYNLRSSGVTLDATLHVTDVDSNSESTWPGTVNYTTSTNSGVIAGLQLIGSGFMGTDVSPVSFSRNVWLVDRGTDVSRIFLSPPSIINSGFTIGGWVYPNSDGAQHPAMLRDRLASLACRHALISRFEATTANAIPTHGFIIGVSGKLAFGAENPQLDPNNADSTLRLFAHVGNTTEATHKHLATPIESGRFTHFTFTYEFIDGTSNQVKLYKDGTLEASTTTTAELDRSNANYTKRALTFGGTESFAVANTVLDYTWSAGHNHIISGLYFFARPLIAAEVDELHGGGGITIDTFATGSGTAISIQDPSLLGYYEFKGKGPTDSSLQRNHLLSDLDSTNTKIVSIPGPFGGHGYWNDGASTINGLIAPSGVTKLLINSSWTIAGWFFAATPATQGHLWSLGEESNTTNRFASLDYQTAGLWPRFTIYRDGTSTGTVVRLIPSGQGHVFNRAWFHATCIYDHRPDTELPYNAFLFINGEQVASGNLGSALVSTAINAGSPLVFLNANSTNSITFDGTKGDTNACANIAIFNRALNPFEVRALAQSGINTSSMALTPYDPRLKSYWKCNEPSGAPLILDYAIYGGSGSYTAALKSHLVPYINTLTLDKQFGSTSADHNRGLELLNNLINANGRGITSGIWVPMGGTCGINQTSVPAQRDSAQNFSYRYLLNQDGKNTREPPYDHDMAIYFEVTPSGNIPRTFTGRETGSCLISCGADTGVSTTNDGWNIFLTDCNRGPFSTSGTAIVFQTRTTNTTYTSIVSGNIPINQTNKVLIRTKTSHDDRSSVNDDNNSMQVGLWINGVLIQRETYEQNSFNLSTNSATNQYRLMIGSYSSPFGAAPGVDPSQFGGLGLNSLREIAFFNGTLTDLETSTLAGQGISPLAGFPTPESRMPMTRVSNADVNLEGYWRFSDPNGSNSGLDLSVKRNDLQLFKPASASSQNSLSLLKVVRGPFKGYPNYNVGASGIGYPQSPTAISFPPFVVSGAGMQNPQNSFSVGIRTITNASSPNTNAGIILCYGPYPRTNNVPQDASWFIGTQNTLDNVYMGLSLDGGVIDTSAIATSSGQTCVGTACKHGTSVGYPFSKFGYNEPGYFQALNQYTFTFNSTTNMAKAYLNGELIDQYQALALHNPVIPENRMISFLVPATGQPSPWTWGNSARSATDLVLSEVFYFSRTLNDAEVRYIAASGIGLAETTSTSGIIGGWLRGLGISSGVAGGYTVGFIPQSSGVAGGYLLALGMSSGVAGGYIRANAVASGVIAGWVRASAISSGVFGGLTYGALSGLDQFDAWYWIQGRSNSDFNALIELNRQNYTDFNAQIEIYEPEFPPLTVIQFPQIHQSGIALPYLEWFVSSGVAVQHKIIERATYSYGDLTPLVNGIPSGNHQYVGTHRYIASGLYNAVFRTIDSGGISNADFRIINLASGVALPQVTLTATPMEGAAPLTVQFTTNVSNLPAGTSIVSQLIDFGDGTSTIRSSPSHTYTSVGKYIPRFIVLDSRNIITTDGLLLGVNY